MIFIIDEKKYNELDEGFALGYALSSKNNSSSSSDFEDDLWTYPEDWLKCPEPTDYQITAVVSIAYTKSFTFSSIYNDIPWGDVTTDEEWYATLERYGVDVDWGDGTVEHPSGSGSATHIYIAGTGTMTSVGEQFLITITVRKNGYNGIYIAPNYYNQWDHPDYGVLVLKYGALMKMWYTAFINNRHSLHQIKLPNDISFKDTSRPNLGDPDLQTYYVLKQVLTPVPLVELPAHFLKDCRNLEVFDYSKVKVIGDYALAGCTRLLRRKVIMPELEEIRYCGIRYYNDYHEFSMTSFIAPKLKKIGGEALSQGDGLLRKVDAPLLEECAGSALVYNKNLTEFNFPESCTFNGGEYKGFGGCYNLHPNPAEYPV